MAIEIRPLTMAVRMKARGIQRIAVLSWYKEAALEHEVTEDDVFYMVNEFCLYSARIVADGDSSLPFELGLATDSADELRRKFDGYLAALTSEIDELEKLVDAADAPFDAALAPEPEALDPEVSGDDSNGS